VTCQAGAVSLAAGVVIAALAGACDRDSATESAWRLSAKSAETTDDAKLLDQIARALNAARNAGTDPSISQFEVRAATVVDVGGRDEVVVGGNTEYGVPEAIHGEVSVVNHVIARFGARAARNVQFIAFYSQTCGDSRGCGDCRDYMRAATVYASLLWVCGQASDRSIYIRKFADGLLDEEQIPEVASSGVKLPADTLAQMVDAAAAAQKGGVTLFTAPERHTGAAVLTSTGRIYKAAGADDAAFHYRYPVGGALQQAASDRDYFVRAVLVLGSEGAWPRVMYRDRQYGFEASSFGVSRGLEPALLILANRRGAFKVTTFEEALPHPFSVARFNPQAVEKFLSNRGGLPGVLPKPTAPR
jgi:cytidine deaminase